jgi:hypothetical protein
LDIFFKKFLPEFFTFSNEGRAGIRWLAIHGLQPIHDSKA